MEKYENLKFIEGSNRFCKVGGGGSHLIASLCKICYFPLVYKHKKRFLFVFGV